MVTDRGGQANDFGGARDQQRNGPRDESSGEPIDLDISKSQNLATGFSQNGVDLDRERNALLGGEGSPIIDGRQVASLQRLTYERSGPLPTVEEFEGYDRVLPGMADRIMTMAEKSLDADIASRRTTDLAEAFSFVGASFAVSFLPWFLFIVAAFLASQGQEYAATATGAAGAVAGGPAVIKAVKGGGGRSQAASQMNADSSRSSQTGSQNAANSRSSNRKSSKKKRKK